MIPILQRDNKLLRKKSSAVPLNEITSTRITKIIRSMKNALTEQEDGVAIAAPQIGENLRIFVVSEKVFDLSEDIMERRDDQKDGKMKEYGFLVFINPKIVKLSRKKNPMEEGCLSVRWLYGSVNRSVKATVQAYDEKGIFFERGASGLMAQVFQHEVDHLEGILFTDKANEIREMQPEDIGI